MRRPDVFNGYIDSCAQGFIRGWAYNSSHPRQRLWVDLFSGDRYLGRTICGFHRRDLELGGLGGGHHQFVLYVGHEADIALATVHARIASHPTVSIYSTGVKTTRALHPTAYLHQYFSCRIKQAQEALGREDTDFHRISNARSRHSILNGVVYLHEIPVSRFAYHIAIKYGYHNISTSIADLSRFLVFYYTEYSIYRAPHRVPMTAEEISYWSWSDGESPCRAATQFAPYDKEVHPSKRAYEWAIGDAVRLCVEDVWVEQKVCRRLRQRALLHGSSKYPHNKFSRHFMDYNLVFERFRRPSRGQVYAAVILFAIQSRATLSFLPRFWVKRMLATNQQGVSYFGSIMRSFTQDSEVDVSKTLERIITEPDVEAPPAAERVLDVQIIGPMNRILGLSESCRRLAASTMSAALNVGLVDYDLGNLSSPIQHGLHQSNLRYAKVTIVHLNLEELPEALAFLHLEKYSEYIIAFPYFELNTLASCHELALELVDEIWAASAFLKTLFEQRFPNTHIVGIPSAGNAPDRPTSRRYIVEQAERLASSIVFLSTADALSWVQRKNILGSIEAFQSAFPEEMNVAMLLKVQNTEHVTDTKQIEYWAKIFDAAANDPRILIVDRIIGAEEYKMLLAGADCLLSLHRAEGLGLDILDAMSFGTPVVATAYSGNMDLCDETTSWLVPYKVQNVGQGEYAFAQEGHTWAEPDISQAARVLRDFMARPDERSRRAARAKEKIEQHASLSAISKRVEGRISDILSNLAGRSGSRRTISPPQV